MRMRPLIDFSSCYIGVSGPFSEASEASGPLMTSKVTGFLAIYTNIYRP